MRAPDLVHFKVNAGKCAYLLGEMETLSEGSQTPFLGQFHI